MVEYNIIIYMVAYSFKERTMRMKQKYIHISYEIIFGFYYESDKFAYL